MSSSRRNLAEFSKPRCRYLNRAPKIWIHGSHSNDASIDAVLDRNGRQPVAPAERRAVTINDRALLIYTSGTTGLPKAASISHRRILNWGGWFAGLTAASPKTGCTIACRSFTASAASSRPAAC